MQDITPTGRKRKKTAQSVPGDLPPEAKKLYEKHAKKVSTKRFTGSSVPVANVHVPKSTLPSRQNNEEMIMERRPLFATIEKKPKHKKATSSRFFSWFSRTAKKETPKPEKQASASMVLGKKETKIALGLSLLVIVTAGLAAFIFLPSANIGITVQTTPLLVDQKITIAANPATVPNSIAGSVFSQQIQVQGTSPVTSTENVGTKAKGTVRIVNKTFDTQKIKERSRLITKDGTLFYMLGPAIIPPANSSSAAATTVEVEAAEAGTAGNVLPQRLNFAALDATAQSLVYGEVTKALTGGSGQAVHVVAEADIKQAAEAAKTQAKTQAEQIARAQLQAGWSLLDESWDVTLSSFTPVQKIGERVDSITYTVPATVQVFAYKSDALTNAIQATLTQQLDENSMLFPGPISYTKSVDSMDWERQQALITARITHSTVPNFSLNTLKEKLVGRSKDDATSYLKGVRGVQSASIKLWPFWVQSIPQIQKRVEIVVRSDR